VKVSDEADDKLVGADGKEYPREVVKNKPKEQASFALPGG